MAASSSAAANSFADLDLANAMDIDDTPRKRKRSTHSLQEPVAKRRRDRGGDESGDDHDDDHDDDHESSDHDDHEMFDTDGLLKVPYSASSEVNPNVAIFDDEIRQIKTSLEGIQPRLLEGVTNNDVEADETVASAGSSDRPAGGYGSRAAASAPVCHT